MQEKGRREGKEFQKIVLRSCNENLFGAVKEVTKRT